MPAPIRKKMRRWNDQIGSRSKRAPGLTVRDMAIPPEKMQHEHTSRRFIVASCRQADCPFGLGRGGPGPLPSLRNTKRSLAKARRAWPRIRLARAGAKVAPALPLHAM